MFERACREVLADVLTGKVPATVASFSELHDYTDANGYGGLCDEGAPFLSPEELCAAGNELQDALDQWIKAGDLAGELFIAGALLVAAVDDAGVVDCVSPLGEWVDHNGDTPEVLDALGRLLVTGEPQVVGIHCGTVTLRWPVRVAGA